MPLLSMIYQEAIAFLPHGAAASWANRSGQYVFHCAAKGIAGDCISYEIKGIFVIFNVLLLVLYKEYGRFC